MSCSDKLKEAFPDIHNYLRERAGVDFDQKTGKGKDQWIKAAKDLQEHILNSIHDIYSQVKLPGYEKLKNQTNEKDNTTDGHSAGETNQSGSGNIQKPAKEKGIFERAKAIEPVDPYDRVLKYFSDGGKIDSSVIQSLFGNNKKSTENQRKSMIGFLKKGGNTIDQLAHSLWESDQTENNTTQDYKEAIEAALNEHGSPTAMAKELISRNDPDEALKKFLNDRYGEGIGSKEDVLDAVSIVEGMSTEEINHLLEMDADETRQNELNNYIDTLHEKNISSPLKTEENASAQSSQQQQASNEQSSVTEHARTEQAGSEGKATGTESSDSNIGSEGRKEKVTDGGGDNEPPLSPPTETENTGQDGFTSVRKEKLKEEIEGAKQLIEKRQPKTWSDVYSNALTHVQEMYPKKSLYEAMKARVDYFVAKVDNKELYNPTSEDIAVFNVFRAKTGDMINDIEGFDSDNPTDRMAALMAYEPLKQDLLNIARVVNPEGEAGRAFGMHQSEVKFDPDYGLKVRRMDLLHASGGNPLSADDMAWTEQKWNEQKELIKQESQLREQALKEDFEKKIADLEAKFNDKTNRPKVDKTIKAKTLSQSGKDVADKIRKLKLSGTKLDFTLGTWNLAVEGIAKLVEGGATIASAIKTLIDKKEIGFKDEKDKEHFEDLFVDRLNKKDKGESLEAIKTYATENNLTDISKEMVGKNLIADYINSHIGEVDQKDLLSTVAKDLKEVLPEVTKKKLIEAYLKEGDYKQETKKDLEGGIAEQKRELKRIAKKEFNANATDTEVQKKLLQEAKKTAEKKMKDFQRRIDEGEYDDPAPKQTLNKTDAELIKLNKAESVIEEQFRKKQRELREANKSAWEKVADFGRSLYVAFLIGSFKTLSKVGSLAVLRPFSEAFTKYTMGKAYKTFFPGIGTAASRGGEGSNWRDIKKGFEAYFIQKSADGIERMSAKSEAAFQKADKAYNDYKQSIEDLRQNNPNAKLPLMDKKLKSLKKERKERLLGTMGNLIYQFIGGSSIQDSLKSLINRSNEIEKQFGKVEGERIGDAQNAYNPKASNLSNVISTEAQELNYVIGFIGRSHSALKTFSGRFSFAAGFMARLEAAVNDNVPLTSDKVLEIAHESYHDWESGKYQQENKITYWWNKQLAALDRDQDPMSKQVSQFAKTLFRTEVAITRVPVNILHEAVMEYTVGAIKAAILGTKAVKNAKQELAEQGFFKDQAGFKAALREQVSKMDSKEAATIVRSFRKGTVGIGLYVLLGTLVGVHFGIFPYLGQKKKKDEALLGPDELNPGQVMFGNNKYGEEMSAIIEHIPALWPTFMGQGMFQKYHDEIKKGRTTIQAVAASAYTHFKILESSIPQTSLIEPKQEQIVNTVKKRLEDSGIIDKSLPNGYEKEDTTDPAFKYVMDKGANLPVFTPSTIEIPDDNADTPIMKKLSELPEKDVTEFNAERKANLKESLNKLIEGESVYLDKYGRPALEESESHYEPVSIDELKPEQLKSVVSLLGGKATKETKAKMFATSDAE